MAHIQTCPKTKLRNNEWLTFCITIRDKINSTDGDLTKFKTEYDKLCLGITNFDNSLNRLNKSTYTLLSNESKRQLNASRGGLFKKIKADLSSTHDDFVEAAKRLMIVVDKFTNISHLSFEDIIGRTESIIGYFQSDEYKDAIELLSLNDRVQQLQTINNKAKHILSQKATETGQRNMIRKAPSTRRELNSAYDLLVSQLNFIARRDGDADYLNLFAFWNALIDKARTTISLRSGATKGGKTDSGTSNQPTTPPVNDDDDDRPVIE